MSIDESGRFNTAPNPRLVEWGKAYQLFPPEEIQAFRNALSRIGDFDFLGLDATFDIEGYGVQGFPDLHTQLALPDETMVNFRIYAATLAQIKAQSSGGDRSAPWGGTLKASLSRTGGLNVEEAPLVLRAYWERLSTKEPLFRATIDSTLYPQEGNEVSFTAVAWDDLGVEGTQKGGLQPASIPSEETATTLIPGSAAFIESLHIAFDLLPPETQQS